MNENDQRGFFGPRAEGPDDQTVIPSLDPGQVVDSAIIGSGWGCEREQDGEDGEHSEGTCQPSLLA